MRIEHLLRFVAALALAGCGDDGGGAQSSGDGGDMGSGLPDDAFDESDIIGEAPEFLASRDDGWLSLLEAAWELEPGTESYRCVRLTVPREVYIGAMKPLIPLGTHHTVLTVNEEPDAEDGVTECTAFVNGQKQLGGSGVGTRERSFPDGVAIRIREGEQLLLNLHLFNISDEALTGRSGMLVKTVEEADVEHMASAMLAGPLNLEIPPGEVTQRGLCSFDGPATAIGLLPHMHQLGTHMKVTALRAGQQDLVLHDMPYSFDDQQVFELDAIAFEAGDQIEVECTYYNGTDSTVTWGDSSLQEMCFAGVFRYPEAPTLLCPE